MDWYLFKENTIGQASQMALDVCEQQDPGLGDLQAKGKKLQKYIFCI